MKQWLVVLLSVVLMTGCSSNKGADTAKEKDKSLKKVTVVLDWTPNTNHTGLYVAKEKGYFKKEGLDVNIINPGEAGADQIVASGKAQFGVGYQEGVTLARVQGVPLVSIAAVIQHNTSGFASPASKNIKSPKDFEGKTYGSWGGPTEKPVIESLMKKEKANVNKVNIVNIGDTDFFTAIKKDIDFTWIYYGWDGISAELRNEKINMVYLTDYSDKLDYYTPVLETNEKMIAQNPDTVNAFLAATTKGYEYAIKNPNQAADILLKAAPDLDPKLVKKSQEWLSTKYQDDASRWGLQKKQVWQNYATWMYDNKLLEKKLDVQKAYTNKFLPK